MRTSNTTLIVRVNQEDKAQAAEILESVGTSLSEAVNMMLKQIIIQNGLPFQVTGTSKPQVSSSAPKSVDRKKLIEELQGSIPDHGYTLEDAREERLKRK